MRFREFLVSASLATIATSACDFEPVDDVTIAIEAPAAVALRDEFSIEIRLHNTGPAERTLVDLDIADEYLEGVMVRRMDPPFSDAMHVPIDNTQSYSLDLAIAPGEEIVLIVYALGAEVGDFSGDFDFCIDSAVRCLSYPVRTLIDG